MRFRQAYLRAACGVLTFLLLVGNLHAQGTVGPSQVLLLPGRSIFLVDAERPGVHAVLTAPANAYLDLSRLAAAGEKNGIFSVLTAAQLNSEATLISHADGTHSLRRTTGTIFHVPLSTAYVPGRVLIAGARAVQAQGRITLYVERAAIPAIVPLPSDGPALLHAGAPVDARDFVADAGAVVIHPGGAVTLDPKAVLQ